MLRTQLLQLSKTSLQRPDIKLPPKT